MEDFEFLRHVTIGQYIPRESLVHRLDPRTKISALLFLTVAITVNTSFTANAILLGFCLGCVLLSKISVRYILSGLKPILPLIVFLALMQLLFYGDTFAPYRAVSQTLWRWGWIHVTNGSVQLVAISILRFLQLLFLTSLLTNTTTTSELSGGMESMLSPLSRLGLPGHELSLVGTIALRFVPILAEQLENIVKAQVSRGGDWGDGSRLRFVRRTRKMGALIVPLFLDAFRRAEDLILAMQARCYFGGSGRTHLQRLSFARRDYLAYTLVLVLSVGLVVLRNRFPA